MSVRASPFYDIKSIGIFRKQTLTSIHCMTFANIETSKVAMLIITIQQSEINSLSVLAT